MDRIFGMFVRHTAEVTIRMVLSIKSLVFCTRISFKNDLIHCYNYLLLHSIGKNH